MSSRSLFAHFARSPEVLGVNFPAVYEYVPADFSRGTGLGTPSPLSSPSSVCSASSGPSLDALAGDVGRLIRATLLLEYFVNVVITVFGILWCGRRARSSRGICVAVALTGCYCNLTVTICRLPRGFVHRRCGLLLPRFLPEVCRPLAMLFVFMAACSTWSCGFRRGPS